MMTEMISKANIQGNRNDAKARDSSKDLIHYDVVGGNPAWENKVAQKLGDEPCCKSKCMFISEKL